MKRTAVLLAAALIMSLAVPAFAIDLTGKVETRLELGQNESDEWEVTGKTGIDLKSAIKASGGQQVRVGLELNGLKWDKTFDDDGDPTGDFAGAYPAPKANPFGISKVWLETDGPFWHGGPSVSTRVGDVNVKWNRLVGHLGNTRGITVQGIEVGPIEARGFYAFDGENNPMGIEAQADINGLELGGMVTYRGDRGADLAAHAAVEAMPGINLDGYAALDADQNSIYRVNAAVDTFPGVTLRAGYRGYNDFVPAYADIHNDDEEDNAYDMHTGFNIGVETEQAGVKLTADYDDPTSTANLKAETQIEQVDVWASTKLVNREMEETKIGAKRVFPVAGLDITGEYEATLARDADAEHVLKAGTTLNMIPELQGLGLNAQVKLVGSQLDSWKAGATYSAPNGIDLGAEYDSVKGPSITAGLKASF